MADLTDNQKKAVQEVLNLLAQKGFSLAEADQVVWGVHDVISDLIQAPAFERAKKPVAEFVSGNRPQPEAS